MAATIAGVLVDVPDLFDNKEWQQCRDAIGRLDTTLADLRKYGFTLVTGLMTASALLTVKAGDGSLDTPSKAAVGIGLMVLVAALFGVDRHYTVVQSGALERALDIEYHVASATQKPDEYFLSQKISANSVRSMSPYAALLLYLALLSSALGLTIAMIGAAGVAQAALRLEAPALALASIVLSVLCVTNTASWRSWRKSKKISFWFFAPPLSLSRASR